MNKKTKKALEESIAHWERMRAFEDVNEFDKERPSDEHCALCELFIIDNCVRCPVMKRTGVIGCEKTPFNSASKASIAWSYGKTKLRAQWRRAATRELNFLRSLR